MEFPPLAFYSGGPSVCLLATRQESTIARFFDLRIVEKEVDSLYFIDGEEVREKEIKFNPC